MSEIDQPIRPSSEPDSPIKSQEESKLYGVTCTYKGSSYREGAQVCMQGNIMECWHDGQWLNTRRRC